MNISKGFRCDEDSKKKFEGFLRDIFKRVEIYTPTGETAPLDMYMTAYTIDWQVWATYAFELKERSSMYPSTRYGGEGQEGWIIERGKLKNLEKAKEEKYRPIYANIFPDGKIAIWNVSKVAYREGTERAYRKHTVDNAGGAYNEAKFEVWYKDGGLYEFNGDSWQAC